VKRRTLITFTLSRLSNVRGLPLTLKATLPPQVGGLRFCAKIFCLCYHEREKERGKREKNQ